MLKKPLTISSSPTEDFLEVTKKITVGHEFSDSIVALSVGDELELDAPYGQFTLDAAQNKVAMLSGGIGITSYPKSQRNIEIIFGYFLRNLWKKLKL